jgi:protein tyrosine phosphatase
MMTNLEEGRRKCEQYWPKFGTADYGPYSVTLAEQKIRADYTIRKLTLTSTYSTRRVHYVTHYQFTSWRDHQVPESAFPLLEFHRRLTENHRPNKGPIVLHCSAGVGRSGAFALLDTALGQAAGERRMDVPDILTRLRGQRMKMVQTPEQYIFVHKAVLEKLTVSSTRVEVARLEAALTELQAHDSERGRSGLEEQFARLEELSPRPDDSFCQTALQHPHKNRSGDYLPTDQWRVPLMDERPDYIHASFACNHRQKQAFIIAQAPMEETCRDFWKMVYERECGVIVMLSGLVEAGRVTCQRYWPTSDVELYGEYAITRLEEQRHNSYIERVFSVTDSKVTLKSS